MFTKNKKVSTTFKRYTGFTLAEVLLTLMIIGIIGVMTIPALIENADREANVTKFKKAYAEIATAVNKMGQDEGVNSNYDLFPSGACPGITVYQAYANNFAKYFNVARGPYQGNCGGFHTSLRNAYKSNTTSPHKYLNGTTITYVNGCGYSFTTNTGLIVGYGRGFPAVVGTFIIDVNGAKGPNTYAKDIFFLAVLKDKIVPYGPSNVADCRNSSNINYCSKAKNGSCCTEKLFSDPNYEIPDT